MWYISEKKTWIPLYILIIFFIIKQKKKQALLIIFFLILTILIADQSSVFFKNFFERLRPCHEISIKDLLHTVNNKCGGKFSFVSSHASNVFAFATFISLFFHKKLISYGILFWALIVSYSRIYLGVHYFFDIIFGILLGITVGLLNFKLYEFVKNSNFKLKF